MIDFLTNSWLWAFGIISVIIIVVLVFFATRNRKIFEDILNKNETKEDAEKTDEKKDIVTFSTKTSLSIEDVEKLKRELQVMDIEKEIVGYALTRLYESEADGKLSEKDRTSLLEKYKDSMERLDKDIEKKQMIVKLTDLEKTKTDLIQMFNTKLDEISKNIDNIKVTLGIKPVESISEKAPMPQPIEIAPTKEKKDEEAKAVPKPRPKSKAEEKIEEIQEEVLKVLERLEQIETEK